MAPSLHQAKLVTAPPSAEETGKHPLSVRPEEGKLRCVCHNALLWSPNRLIPHTGTRALLPGGNPEAPGFPGQAPLSIRAGYQACVLRTNELRGVSCLPAPTQQPGLRR